MYQQKLIADVTLGADADFSAPTVLWRAIIEVEEAEAMVELSAPMVISGIDASQIDWEIDATRVGGGDLGLVQATNTAGVKQTINPFHVAKLAAGHHTIRLLGQSAAGAGVVEAAESPVYVTARILSAPEVHAYNVNSKSMGIQEG